MIQLHFTSSNFILLYRDLSKLILNSSKRSHFIVICPTSYYCILTSFYHPNLSTSSCVILTSPNLIPLDPNLSKLIQNHLTSSWTYPKLSNFIGTYHNSSWCHHDFILVHIDFIQIHPNISQFIHTHQNLSYSILLHPKLSHSIVTYHISSDIIQIHFNSS